jgi:Tol biopolymer transport system component
MGGRVFFDVLQRRRVTFTFVLLLALLFLPLTIWWSAFAHDQPGETGPHSGETPPAVSPLIGKDATQTEERLLTNIRQVTFAVQRAGEGYFSQDGSLLVFQSEREADNPFFQIYVANLATGDIRRVSPGRGKTTCGWIHPNKKDVLFASTHHDPHARAKQQAELDQRTAGEKRRYAWDFDEHYDLFRANLSGKALVNLTHTRGYDAEAAWSPDGSLIVFTSNRRAYTGELSDEERAAFASDPSSLADIYLMKADGTEARRLTTMLGYDGGPFFSADGKKICWRRFSTDGFTAEVWTMNIDGGEPVQLTHLGAMSWAPYFHPSGDYVIFATNLQGHGNFELYLIDAAAASQPVRVTYTDGFDSLPAFSPDGKTLTWTSSRTADKKAQIFFADWNDAEARRLLGLTTAQGPSETLTQVEHVLFPPDARTVPAINANDLRLHVETLASRDMDGRLTGTEGEHAATEYVADVFRQLGLTHAGDHDTFFQSFPFTAGVSLGVDNRLTLSGKEHAPRAYTVDSDWRPLAFSKTGEVAPSGIVFAGYGIVAPATNGQAEYDSYTHLEVKDKWVMVFRYLPEGVTPEVRQHLNHYAPLRFKAIAARDRGARGLIVVSGPNTRVKEQLVPLTFDSSLAGTSIAAITVTDQIAEQLLQPMGKTLKELQDALDTGAPVLGFSLSDVELSATLAIQQEKRMGRNVLGRLTAGKTKGKSSVVIGAHVDHLGHGVGANSLAREEEKGQIHYGADDNASGVAGLLEIAQYLADLQVQGKLPLKHDVLFAAWSGEELGLLGSSYFTRTFAGQSSEPTSLRPAVAAYLNMDMIGRLTKNVVIQGIGSSTRWLGEVERYNLPIGLPMTVQHDSYLPTDATAFYLKEVPILNAFTGAHADYHTPRDTADKLNYHGAKKITHLFAALTAALATRPDAPDYRRMEKPPSTVGRVALRAYLGTIPDYAQTDVMGVKLSGVAKGGPAEKAGIQSGDVVVELTGKKIENIYDYTYALDGLRIGTPVEMVVLRGEQRVTLTVTPGTRE